jgi:hypothetical protein
MDYFILFVTDFDVQGVPEKDTEWSRFVQRKCIDNRRHNTKFRGLHYHTERRSAQQKQKMKCRESTRSWQTQDSIDNSGDVPDK